MEVEITTDHIDRAATLYVAAELFLANLISVDTYAHVVAELTPAPDGPTACGCWNYVQLGRCIHSV